MSQMIPWLSQYEVHVSDIDHQHRELFRMLNGLLDATWDGKGKEFTNQALQFMANYTVNHFATEEAYMRTYAYPGYTEHKKVHDDLTTQVVEFIRSYNEKGITTELLVTMVLELGNWTRDHIREMDRKLGQFLVSKRPDLGSAPSYGAEDRIQTFGSASL